MYYSLTHNYSGAFNIVTDYIGRLSIIHFRHILQLFCIIQFTCKIQLLCIIVKAGVIVVPCTVRESTGIKLMGVP